MRLWLASSSPIYPFSQLNMGSLVRLLAFWSIHAKYLSIYRFPFVDTELIFVVLCSGHSSMIYFVDDVEGSPAAQNLALRDLPLRDVGQHFPFCYCLVACGDLHISLIEWTIPNFRFFLFLKRWRLVLDLTAILWSLLQMRLDFGKKIVHSNCFC